MTLNCIWWLGYSSEDLENVEYAFITITPRSTLTRDLAIKGYSNFPKVLELVPHHQMQFNLLPRTQKVSGMKILWNSCCLTNKLEGWALPDDSIIKIIYSIEESPEKARRLVVTKCTIKSTISNLCDSSMGTSKKTKKINLCIFFFIIIIFVILCLCFFFLFSSCHFKHYSF